MTAPSLGAGSAGDVERLTHEERGWLRVTRFGNFVHLETAVERILAAHVARASPADRERVARVEAVSCECYGGPHGGFTCEACR